MHGRDILLVDDDKDFVQVLGLRLRKHGYNVITAADGYRGSQVAKKEKPDLIILDLRMPGKDGIATGEDLLKSNDTMLIPVIVLTALDDPKKRKMAQEFGAVAYITKPFDEEYLMSVIANILGC